MTNDDTTARLTSRRGFLTTAALGATGLVVATTSRSAAAVDSHSTALADLAEATTCLAMTPTQEVGPFYVAYNHIRSNIRANQAGIHLRLHIKVINVTTCKPIHNAALDIWHANAVGVYSDEASENSTGTTYLRGVQLTDSDGRAMFQTIMPGWYQGRVNHIHAKVRLNGSDSNDVYSGGTTAHIGQMFFKQSINDACSQIAPYTSNQQQRITNATDRVYTQQNGSQCKVRISGSTTDGYVAHTTLGIT